MDYEDVFAPVVRQTTLRTLIALTCANDWEIEQSDISTAFLNAPLSENVYMAVPSGVTVEVVGGQLVTRLCVDQSLVKSPSLQYVLKLNKSIYGLKQSPRNWHHLLDHWLTTVVGFVRSTVDPCLFTLVCGDDCITLTIYVDDLVYGGTRKMVDKFKQQLSERFKVTHDGPLSWVLGMEILRNRTNQSIVIRQTKYINDILERFNMQECNPCDTPAVPGNRLTKQMEPSTEEEISRMNVVPYASLVGALMYVMTCTRPDISFSVIELTRFMRNPGPEHWTAAKRVLRYLKSTQLLGIRYHGNKTELSAYSDSDWASDTETRKSTTGYIMMICNGPISWQSKRQSVIALSSVEAEYYALTATIQEVIHLQQLLLQLDVKLSNISVHIDSKGGQFLAESEGFRPRSKHIDVKHHFIRDKIADGTVQLVHIPTQQMLADVLTKPARGEVNKYFMNAVSNCM